MKKPYIRDYVKLRFFDTLNTQVGADVLLSNDEILGEIEELNTVSTTVLQSLAGIASGGVNLHPQGFRMSVTMREDKERLGTTWYKIDRLLNAIHPDQNYRIEFSLLHGRRLDDVALHTFLEYPVVWTSAVFEFDQQSQRQITLGVGLRGRTEFTMTVYQAITLSLPQQPAAGGSSAGVGTINLGNGSGIRTNIIITN